MTNHIDRLGRTISTPRDLSKTHRRAYIAYAGDEITYFRTEQQALDAGATQIVPCMISNAWYDELPA